MKSILENKEFKKVQGNWQSRNWEHSTKLMVESDIEEAFKNGAVYAEQILTKQFEEESEREAFKFTEWILDSLLYRKIEVEDGYWIKGATSDTLDSKELHELYLKEKQQ